MLRLSVSGRTLLADKVSDVANVAAGAMVFGPFLSDQPFSMGLTVLGIAMWACLVWCAVALVERKD